MTRMVGRDGTGWKTWRYVCPDCGSRYFRHKNRDGTVYCNNCLKPKKTVYDLKEKTEISAKPLNVQ